MSLKVAILRDHWFPLVLLLLILASLVSIHTALFTAFVFTFFVPGLAFLKFFRLAPSEVAVFAPIFSVLSSTHLVYCLSLIFGYSKETIFTSFLIWTGIYVVSSWTAKTSGFNSRTVIMQKIDKKGVTIFLFIFLISLIILYKSVWFESEAGVVITGSNWQDTPLHYAIIESINNGNFPPQMPHFSGVKMNYHYFVDFHTAILEKVYGFLPKLLPFLNCIFILIFALAVYTLAKVNGEREALFSTLIATFGWGFSYLLLFSALFKGEFNPAENYIYQYGGFFGLPPVFDNLLQQRPLLVGLPAFTFVLNLLRKLEDKGKLALAGIITGLLFPFHVMAFFCCLVAYLVSVVLNLKNLKLDYLCFVIPAVVALPFILSTRASVFITEPWICDFSRENPILYCVGNLGIPFLASLASFIFFKKVEEKFLKGVFIILFAIPNLISFTPNPWDMYKFFTFSWIPISVLSGTLLARTKREIATLLLLLSFLTSASVILYNVSTSYVAANWSEYEAGMWIRDNTEEKSVFLTYYSIHSPSTMIGGRMRVLSYLNWPYGHGIKLQEIWSRMEDVDKAYSGSLEDLERVVKKYGVNYIYVGREEIANYPKCVEKFSNVEWLKLVYDKDVKIYKVLIK